MSNLIKAARLIITQPKTIENIKLATLIKSCENNDVIEEEAADINDEHIEIGNEHLKELYNENDINYEEDEKLAEFFQCVTNNDEIIGVQSVTKQVEKILRETEEIVEEKLKKAKEEAESIISAAQDNANKINLEIQEKIQEAEKQINLWQQDAFNQGFQDGYSEGKNQIEFEYQELIKSAKNELAEAQEERKKIINGAEKEIIQLAIAVSEKIIHHEINQNSDYILDIVKAAMSKVNDREELTLKVNPEDIDFIIANQEEIKSSTKGINKMKIQSDNTITQGGCVIETPIGTIDGRIERQVNEIEKAMMDVIEDV